MDGISAAASVAGLVTLAEVVISRIYNTILACKNASNDARKLLREMQSVAGILHSIAILEKKLVSGCLSTRILGQQILSCQFTLQEIRDMLEQADPKQAGISIMQRAKRTLTWPITSSKTEKLVQDLERHKSTFDLAMSIDAIDVLLEAQQSHGIAAVKTHETHQILQRLQSAATSTWYRRLVHRRGPFREWLATENGKLWVYGIPGAGKTILASLAMRHVMGLASTEFAVAYYFCDYRHERTRCLPAILANIIGQLARQNEECMQMLQDVLHASEDGVIRPDLGVPSHLMTLLKTMLRACNSVAILVDRLDECHEPAEVTGMLCSMTDDSASVRMLLSSRRERDIEFALAAFRHLSIAAESQDLRLYVPTQIEERSRKLKLRIRNVDVKDRIIEKLVNGADGMYVDAITFRRGPGRISFWWL
ncbi:hypothetical protein LTR85_004784 [Meristemomyces frigidus]|nr:hypothetical protein LTR85_004784 [Meristemomyces frigidus]